MRHPAEGKRSTCEYRGVWEFYSTHIFVSVFVPLLGIQKVGIYLPCSVDFDRELYPAEFFETLRKIDKGIREKGRVCFKFRFTFKGRILLTPLKEHFSSSLEEPEPFTAKIDAFLLINPL